MSSKSQNKTPFILAGGERLGEGRWSLRSGFWPVQVEHKLGTQGGRQVNGSD